MLWVRDPHASAQFYHQALGLETTHETERAVFMASPLSGTDHDLGLFQAQGDGAPPSHVGLYHLAWEVKTLPELAAAKDRLSGIGALVGENNHGTSRSLYAQDPDGIEFEIMWEVPAELHEADDPSNIPLDLDGDIARYGADQPSRGALIRTDL